MTTDEESLAFLFTGAFSISHGQDPSRILGLASGVSPLEAPATVQLQLHRANCEVHDDGTHVSLHLSESSARALAEVLVRVVERASHLRALHRQGVLKQAALLPGPAPSWMHRGGFSES